MNTKQITRGAMVCAIYGALLLLNQQTALAIETSASWLFVFPVLIYTAMNGVKPGGVCTIAMALMTFLFGGFTTWFYSWTGLVTGYVYGIGLFKHFKNMVNFVLCLIFSLFANFCTIWVWATLFGVDIMSEYAGIKELIPFINLQVFIILFVVVMALLQALCIHCIAILVCMRMKIPFEPLRPLSTHNSPRWMGIVSIFVWVLFYLCQNVIECSQGLEIVSQLLWFTDCIALVYFGIVYLLHFCTVHGFRKIVFFVVMFAFVPGFNFMYMVIGETDCLFQLRSRGLV